ncbi:hypothetical protein PHYBLDRAFT_62710 [Phycomyces blakesleeanus NRRL 1555(-)]|uniref:Uncharacterized protein n=1 Tax=Phycomyces blakesleeanus (strain ATCC 8743b / DSM 1359 / FGSC 10004 / NBRC 33097 / NRRL 1555) TaxID=763407 RepID=A0A167PTR8_PHYB8|nr:hypothetical protein PHYBLDRAFT_62710 [Phycomyces blakesleeanus NRRL 1555(-)]OAD78524.1 hypothetical protein PHYBLDRAFT_62710 [Phycomyces blakesleeanus NRRL 1555(-)]|eukprot:XP_018296564.1 hypothetical protein PHYBLDRAFT_62710 [Phycomyces blakesleeanus NRRL 1555(-)]
MDCLEIKDPIKPRVISWVPCPVQKLESPLDTYRRLSYLQLTSDPLPQSTKSAPFEIDLQCLHVSSETCAKAKKAFDQAGSLISSAIFFREPVRVNATFLSFCESGGECGSSPARLIPLLNEDGMVRLHPQSLVKQLDMPISPEYSHSDILSVFNADAPFWFEHEFMHGLGFYSNWSKHIPSIDALVPDPSLLLADETLVIIDPQNNAVIETKFLENVLDKYMVILNPESEYNLFPTSDLTRQFNKIEVNSTEGLIGSPEFGPAFDMSRLSVLPGTLGIGLVGPQGVYDDFVILETSLVPFQRGSSISHVDYNSYTDTPDFLMRYMQDRGVTMTDMVLKGGGDSPLGPKLLRIMEQIGYTIIKTNETESSAAGDFRRMVNSLQHNAHATQSSTTAKPYLHSTPHSHSSTGSRFAEPTFLMVIIGSLCLGILLYLEKPFSLL